MAQNVAVDLGFRPRKWQFDCLTKLRRFSVLVVHRRAGKTVMAVMKLIDAALKNQREKPRPPSYAYIAPYRNQAKEIAWKYLATYARMIPGTKVNESDLFVEFPNGSRIKIYGADNPDALRGQYLDGVILDEFADMRPDVWDEICLPMLSDFAGWAIFIGTPKGVNRFSELYDRATGADWFRALFDVYSTDALDPDEIETQKANQSDAGFRQEFLCDFTAANENTLIPITLATEARGKHLRAEQYEFAAKIIGVDVARYGDDRTVIFKRQGLASFEPIVLRGADSMTVAARVAHEAQGWSADAVFVDGSGGYGAGVIDRLRQIGMSVIEVQFGGKPTDPRFANKRTEMFWSVKEWLESGGAIPPTEGLVQELSAPQYTLDNAKGLLALEPKDEIKKRVGASPDLADALALTFAHPVLPKVGGSRRDQSARIQRKAYDPVARR